MALYNVVEPAIVDGRHYTRPSVDPVEVDDAEAKPLVEAGVLVPVAVADEAAVVEKPARRARAADQEAPAAPAAEAVPQP